MEDFHSDTSDFTSSDKATANKSHYQELLEELQQEFLIVAKVALEEADRNKKYSYKGKDGKDYTSYDSLKLANKIYNETMFEKKSGRY